ncbi:MAG: MFS transporter [Campylobacterota bacterium]|nr:MFS transporter [Campylobacterota bacterium]
MKDGVRHWLMFKIKGTFAYIAALFLNAFTDLGHKIIIQNTIFKIYDDEMQIMLTAVVNALVLLPFIMLFSPAGFLADKFPKNVIMKHAAAMAVVITLLITLSYYMGWFIAAFVFTFLLAMQSAVYAPAKYGYIKELVGEKYISSGNAAVQSATTVAILSGIIFYTVLFENSLGTFHSENDVLKQIAPLGWLLVIGSIVEWFLASSLPDKMSRKIKKRFNIKKYQNGYYLRKNLKIMFRKPLVWEAVVSLSVFWAVSQVLLSIFGAHAKSELGIDNAIVVQGVMALAAIGIVLGSVASAKFSRYFIHFGSIPLGAILMAAAVAVLPYLKDIEAIAMIFLLFGLGAGIFIVPLNAYIQKSAPPIHLGSILAGNNFIQTIFMFAALMLTTFFAYNGLSTIMLFWLLFMATAGMALYLLKKHLIVFIWLIFELLLSLRYKIVYEGTEHLGKEGAILLLGNHISWIDWLIIQFPVERRIHFLMDRDIYEWKWINPIMRLGKAIPISPRASREGFALAREHIVAKEVVGMFPEGAISHTGEMEKFYRGFELIGGTLHGKIVPLYIDGLYGSIFSRAYKHKTVHKSLFRRVITIRFGEPMPLQSSAEEVKSVITELKDVSGIK